MKAKVKFAIILSVEFVAIALLLVLVFFAGKKSYDVTFDLNGGTLISGDIDQRVTQGQNAVPPNAVKEGHYLLGWAGSYKGVTSDRTIKAIWEYETSPGIEYSDGENMTYCEIVGSYPDISGEIYIGAYHNEKVVLGIKEGAFRENGRITAIHLLDGILRIEDSVFEGCSALETIDIPSTVITLGARVFAECESLLSITLPEGLEVIGDGAFLGCSSLESITIPSTVKAISESAFRGCTALKEVIFADRVVEVKVEDDGSSTDKLLGKKLDEGEVITETYPSAVTSIGARAFEGCSALISVVLPDELEFIAADAFRGCSELTVYTSISEADAPAGFETGWSDDLLGVVWDYIPPKEDNNEAKS